MADRQRNGDRATKLTFDGLLRCSSLTSDLLLCVGVLWSVATASGFGPGDPTFGFLRPVDTGVPPGEFDNIGVSGMNDMGLCGGVVMTAAGVVVWGREAVLKVNAGTIRASIAPGEKHLGRYKFSQLSNIRGPFCVTDYLNRPCVHTREPWKTD